MVNNPTNVPHQVPHPQAQQHAGRGRGGRNHFPAAGRGRGRGNQPMGRGAFNPANGGRGRFGGGRHAGGGEGRGMRAANGGRGWHGGRLRGAHAPQFLHQAQGFQQRLIELKDSFFQRRNQHQQHHTQILQATGPLLSWQSSDYASADISGIQTQRVQASATREQAQNDSNNYQQTLESFTRVLDEGFGPQNGFTNSLNAANRGSERIQQGMDAIEVEHIEITRNVNELENRQIASAHADTQAANALPVEESIDRQLARAIGGLQLNSTNGRDLVHRLVTERLRTNGNPAETAALEALNIALRNNLDTSDAAAFATVVAKILAKDHPDFNENDHIQTIQSRLETLTDNWQSDLVSLLTGEPLLEHLIASDLRANQHQDDAGEIINHAISFKQNHDRFDPAFWNLLNQSEGSLWNMSLPPLEAHAPQPAQVSPQNATTYALKRCYNDLRNLVRKAFHMEDNPLTSLERVVVKAIIAYAAQNPEHPQLATLVQAGRGLERPTNAHCNLIIEAIQASAEAFINDPNQAQRFRNERGVFRREGQQAQTYIRNIFRDHLKPEHRVSEDYRNNLPIATNLTVDRLEDRNDHNQEASVDYDRVEPSFQNLIQSILSDNQDFRLSRQNNRQVQPRDLLHMDRFDHYTNPFYMTNNQNTQEARISAAAERGANGVRYDNLDVYYIPKTSPTDTLTGGLTRIHEDARNVHRQEVSGKYRLVAAYRSIPNIPNPVVSFYKAWHPTRNDPSYNFQLIKHIPFQ